MCSAHHGVSLRVCLHGSEPHTLLLVRTSETYLSWLRHVPEQEAAKECTGESALWTHKTHTWGRILEDRLVLRDNSHLTYGVSSFVTLTGKSWP